MKILCVDVSNQVHKGAAVHPYLTAADGRYTGGLFGVLKAVTMAIQQTDATQIIFCRDMKPYVRTQQYSEYKALRKKEADLELQERVHISMQLVEEFCEVLGVPYWGIPGFEADDLIAHVVKTAPKGCAVVAASSDSDLYQLFDGTSRFSMWKGKDKIYTNSDFEEEFQGLGAQQYLQLLSLTGTHNEVQGLAGIGPVKGRKILEDPVKRRAVFDSHADLLARNLELIKLPHAEFPADIAIPNSLHGGLPTRKFYRFCGKYDIEFRHSWEEMLSQVL